MKQLDSYMNTLATSHGWATRTPAPLLPIFGELGYRSELTMLEGALGGQRFWFYICAPSNSVGTTVIVNSRPEPVTLLSVEYPQTFPDLIIMPASGIMGMAYDVMARSTFGFEPLQLEGDFSQHVRVYAKRGQEVDVLQYLSPDVMAVIEDHIQSFVILSGNYVSVSAYMPLTPKSLDMIFSDTEVLLRKIAKYVH